MKCQDCLDTGWVGDNGPGKRGNNEYMPCDCEKGKAITRAIRNRPASGIPTAGLIIELGNRNEPFIQNLPYIKVAYMPCCPQCDYNCGYQKRLHPISDFLLPPTAEPRFTCPSCGTRFDVVATLDRQKQIREGLSLMRKGEECFKRSVEYYKKAASLINMPASSTKDGGGGEGKGGKL